RVEAGSRRVCPSRAEGSDVMADELITRLAAANPVPPDGHVHLTEQVPRTRSSSLRRNVRLMLALAGIVIVAVVVAVATLKIGSGTEPASKGIGHHPRGLTGATIQLAGYRFRTPTGFKRSSSSCADAGPLLRAFSAAASAE